MDTDKQTNDWHEPNDTRESREAIGDSKNARNNGDISEHRSGVTDRKVIRRKKPRPDFHVDHLISLLGNEAVLIPVADGNKGPRYSGWNKFDSSLMQDPAYLDLLYETRFEFTGSAVLNGAPSGGLCSIDIDDDDAVEPFLAINPKLAETLRSRGRRGCNVWVKIEGDYPSTSTITTEAGKPWGEWRATGSCTMIHGTHPHGMQYVRCPEVPPISISFDEIQWPDDLSLPWQAAMDSAVADGYEESDHDIVDGYGQPFYCALTKEGDKIVRDINQSYWAALYAKENTILHEPTERVFYGYSPETGLFSEMSPDFIKQGIARRILEVSRQNNAPGLLERFRPDPILIAVVSQLRGIAEYRNAFIDRPRAVHLSNCMLLLENGELKPVAFSPEFRSRNRSPVAFDPKAECPRFLNELLYPAVKPDDVVLLQKMAGQFLLGENLTQRCLILDGVAGGGKSQFSIVIQGLIGRENFTQLRTNHLGDRFELFRFMRRSLLVGVDVDADFMSSKGATVIKGLVGGDWFDAEQKGGTGSFQFQGKFNTLLTSNCRLRVKLQGDVDAWQRRFLIVRYESPPPVRKIPNFGDLLIREEGAGILNWMLEGLLMLWEDIELTGDIRVSPRQKDIVSSLMAESDSLRHFLANNVKLEEGKDLTVGEIVQAYAHYCPDQGWNPLPESLIGRQLPSLMLELFQKAKSNSCSRDGRAARGFRGVTFINPELHP